MLKKYHKIKIKNTIKRRKYEISSRNSYKYLFAIPIVFFIFLFILVIFRIFNKNKQVEKEIIFDLGLKDLDKFKTYIFDNIKEKLEKYKCSIMWKNQKEFLNGVIRKFKAKKILEVGVAMGG